MKFIILAGCLLFCSCASTRYIRFDVIDGTASYNALTQSASVESGTVRFYKAVSNDEKMPCPDGFFDEREISGQ